MLAPRRTGVATEIALLHFILGPLQPSNAAAFEFSQMGIGGRQIISKSIGKNKAWPAPLKKRLTRRGVTLQS
jgi:hypothetical protein